MKLTNLVGVRLTILALITINVGMNAHLFAQSVLDQFPTECSMASDREALPGHIIRLGFINHTPMGWSLLFPDPRMSDKLQRVGIADNVGIIGQDPDADLSDIVRARTPNGSFVVAQIFVGDESGEPVVTCLSKPRMLSSYQPNYYGSEFLWLEPVAFRRWRSFERYDDWGWRRWYGRDFGLIRNKYREYHREHRPHHNWKNKERERGLRDKIDKNQQKPDRRDFDKRKPLNQEHNKSHMDRKGPALLDMKKGDSSNKDTLKTGFIKTREQNPPTIKKPNVKTPIAAEEQEKKPGGRVVDAVVKGRK